jgi:hypothetical protein
MVLETIIRTARKTEERIQQATLARLHEIETATATALETLSTSCGNATSSPGSSASTPAGGASERSPGRRAGSSRKTGSRPAA